MPHSTITQRALLAPISRPVVPLLDRYGLANAIACYSPFRKARTAYTGPALRVRRSSDDVELDIGFVDGLLDVPTLLSHCGAGNGFVTTVYDQSGNNNDQVQTTGANQPRVVTSGALVLRHGVATISHDTNSTTMTTTGNVTLSDTGVITAMHSGSGGVLNKVVFRSGISSTTQKGFYLLMSPSNVMRVGIAGASSTFNLWDRTVADQHRRLSGMTADLSLAAGVEVVPINGSNYGTTGWTQVFANNQSGLLEDRTINTGDASHQIFWDCSCVWKRVLSASEVAEASDWFGYANDGASVGDSTVADYSSFLAIPNYLYTDREQCQRHGVAPLAVAGHTIAQQKTVWQAYPQANELKWVIVQIGLNDCNPATATATTVAALQDLVDTIRAAVNSSCKIIMCTMTPAYERWSAVSYDPATAQAKWVAMNEAIMGRGSSPITGVDFRREEHTTLLSKDVSGNAALADAYDSGDHIHENAAGRAIVAQSWRYALERLGLL